MSNENRNLPTHRVYAVTRRNPDDKKGRWDEIGAAWAHADGKGFKLKLSYLPLNGGEIVVREPLPAATTHETTAAEGDAQ